MGRLWRGMGGMGRPEPLSAHRPRRQQTRAFRIPRFSRNTAFFRITAFLPSRQTADARRRQARRLQGGMYEARENEWKGVFLNPETGITTYTESGFGSRFGIPHYSSVFVGKIRISPYRPSSAPEHCGSRGIGLTCMSHHMARQRANGPRITSHALSSSSAVRHFFWSKPDSHQWFSRITKHESRLFFETRPFIRLDALFTIVHHCSRLFTIVRYCSAKKYCPGKCLHTVSRSRKAWLRALVAFRAPWAAATTE